MKYRLLLVLSTFLIFGCETNDGDDTNDGFDRTAMLTNWADNLIIPAYNHYYDELTKLDEAKDAFVTDQSEVNLQTLRTSWKEAYKAWQWVGMYQIGQSESIYLLGFTNTFPADAAQIENLIASGEYNFELPTRMSQQGFPALDYLINGLGADDAAILAVYQGDSGASYVQYLSDVVDRLLNLTSQVVDNWNQGYRETFIANSGSSKSSAVDKLVNDYISYFEGHIRKAKIGDPAGVFTGVKDPNTVEGFYQSDIAKSLFLESLKASKAFFNGEYFDQTGSGESLFSYLKYLNTIKETEALEELINEQFDLAEQKSSALSDNFSEQVVLDNTLMLETYQELQRNVVFMKVDMLSAMSIAVDYMDNDGD
ncbi:imelysin family protein [Reichenbachiella ulvae]|uniref:Imelysin family protein n=1 Tax=Reichenbachiella ulvae TaxID=2980104 RepID=A0ABT3CQT3_9BACT|nr:imelysin family protein [Reichenbachiella ulvae]MCV9385913.1 imelysin family protein [Reichenbachiella ulvae]